MNFNKRYFLDENNKPDELCASLNCWEQYLYFALKDYNINCKLVFCEDINICYSILQDTIMRNNVFPDSNLYDIQRWENPDNPAQVIEKIINDNKIAICIIGFNLLEPYIWFDNNIYKLHTDHNMGIIGFDEQYYYFIDSPLLIIRDWEGVYRENPCIFKIEKQKFLYVCKFYCEISEISIREEAIKTIKSLDEVIKAIVNNYYVSDIIDNHYIGKKALEVFKESIINKDSINSDFFKDQFLCHLIYSRHLILKRCLEEDISYSKKHNFKIILDSLDKVTEQWFCFTNLILKNMYKPIDNFKSKIIDIITKIQKKEEILITNLKYK